MNCIFGDALAIAVFHLSRGCACYPNKIQPLCAQHLIKAEPLGSMQMIRKLQDHVLLEGKSLESLNVIRVLKSHVGIK